MPELPEVEIIVRQIDKEFVGLTLDSFNNISNKYVIPKAILSDYIGKPLTKVFRIGKNLIFDFDGLFIVINLGMTGKLLIGHLNNDKHLHFSLNFKDKFLYFYDIRRFGKIKFTNDINNFFKEIDSCSGIDLLIDSSVSGIDKFKNKPKNIKQLLLSGKWIVGIGNIYACEILFNSGVSPIKTFKELSDDEIFRIINETSKIFNYAIKHGGSTISDYVDLYNQKGKMQNFYNVYGRENLKCYKCGSIISRLIQNGRSTYYCNKCQK